MHFYFNHSFLFYHPFLHPSQAAQGLHSEAAASTSHAVAAAKQGGGDLTRCLIETAQAYHAHAKLLDQVQALSPALDAAMRSLEFAHESGSKIHIIRAAVLGAVIHNRRAAAANQVCCCCLYLCLVQMLVLAAVRACVLHAYADFVVALPSFHLFF